MGKDRHDKNRPLWKVVVQVQTPRTVWMEGLTTPKGSTQRDVQPWTSTGGQTGWMVSSTYWVSVLRPEMTRSLSLSLYFSKIKGEAQLSFIHSTSTIFKDKSNLNLFVQRRTLVSSVVQVKSLELSQWHHTPSTIYESFINKHNLYGDRPTFGRTPFIEVTSVRISPF